MILACGAKASADAVGITLRGVLSNSCKPNSASIFAIPILTADGTRFKARAAAEKEPVSSTFTNNSIFSLVKFIIGISQTESYCLYLLL
jgi:hypothetical protein